LEGDWNLFALMSAWFASLRVVVEGWNQVPLSDPSVDELLAANPHYVELLNRYRNSVFHYQPSFGELHERQKGLLGEGETAVQWLFLLQEEFSRVYWERIPRATADLASDERYAKCAAELTSEMRHCMLSLVGWIPDGIVPAHARKARENADAAVALLIEAGDLESDAAVQVLQAARQAAVAAGEVEVDYQGLKSELVRRVKAR
jgi:hypothetical protein